MLKKALTGFGAMCVCLALAAPTALAATDVVLYAGDATNIHGNWSRVADVSAGGGQKMSGTDKGWSSPNAALAAPADYFDFGAAVAAATPYHIWLRLQATKNSKNNDSLWVQFSDAIDGAGNPIYQIGTTSALLINLATDNSNTNGWGWSDGAYWLQQVTTLRFSGSTTHTIRIQTREDGVQVDQVVLSPSTYLTKSPGTAKLDKTIVAKPSGSTASTPYSGIPAAVPGTIEAENFDNGGEGIAYHDATTGNTGGAYRSTDVDIETATDGAFDVGWTAPTEWLAYTVNVAAPGTYVLEARVSSSGRGGTFHVEFGGVNATGALTIPDTGGWQDWTTVTKTVTLTAGQQLMKLVFDTNGATSVGNVTWLRLTTNVNGPYGGTPAALPGTIRTENFDNGGEGSGYHDTTSGNSGAAYRATDVDIQASSLGGYNIGWIADGEWLAYTVNVATAGTYVLQVQVASPQSSGQMHASFGGVNTATVAVPNTGDWQAWTTVTLFASIPAGPQVMKLVFDVGGFNVAGITATSAVAPSVPNIPASPSPSTTASGITTTPTLTWSASGATSYDVAFGTSGTPAIVSKGQSAASYTPAALANGTTYFWQVIARNSSGGSFGPVWSFTTAAPVVLPPSAPASPSPSAGANSVTSPVTLAWSATGATTYDLYVGTSPVLQLAASDLTTASFSIGSPVAGTLFYWQVVAKNTAASAAGPVWSFTTAAAAAPPSAPAAPASPSPASGSIEIATNATLTWTATGATSYDLNFGTSPSPSLAASGLSSASFTPPAMLTNTKYYWQVIARNSGGSTAGPVWSFTTDPPATGRTITVNAGGDLQIALNNALPGDTILLQAGATFTGNFVLPNKNGTDYVTIRSSAPDASLPGPSARIDPSYAALLPKIKSPNSSAALATEAGANRYKLMFLEFQANYQGLGDIVDLGDGSSAQNSLTYVPHDLIVDRVYIHGDPTYGQKRGIGLNSASTSVLNSYISGMRAPGQDSQAICGWNGPGPFVISNNYLEAASENILFGGADPKIANLVPSDITITGNYISKPLAWKSQTGWNVKNLFELKNAQRVVINGNIFENNWVDAQSGYAIALTVRNQDGTAPWSVVQHVQFTNNIVRHAGAGVNILGADNNAQSQVSNDFVLRNNLFEDISGTTWGGQGRWIIINGGYNITVDHNTVFQDGWTSLYSDTNPTSGFTFTNNIIPDYSWAVLSTAAGVGNPTIASQFPGSTFRNGIFAGSNPAIYPANNYYPAAYSAVGFVNQSGGNYRLASTSPYKSAATDGKDVGADIDAINAATGANY